LLVRKKAIALFVDIGFSYGKVDRMLSGGPWGVSSEAGDEEEGQEVFGLLCPSLVSPCDVPA
jgi:hypothetical protein